MGNGDSSLSGLMKNRNFQADEILYVGLQGLHDYQEKFLKDTGVGFKVQTEEFISDDEMRAVHYRIFTILYMRSGWKI